MTSAAMRKTPDEQFGAEIGGIAASEARPRIGLPGHGAEGHASPVHEMQARLEQAVFASFSAKEGVGASHPDGARAIAIVVAAALGGWGLLFAGLTLNLF